MSLRILVIDDSASYGGIITRALSAIPGTEVIGRCTNGRAALHRIRTDAPDLVTLDVEMPEMNGIEVLKSMRREGLKAQAIMLSAAGSRARELTIKALELGALDFLTKPEGDGGAENLETLRARLTPLVAAAAYRKEVRTLLAPVAAVPASALSPPPTPSAVPSTATATTAPPKYRVPRGKPSMVLIGSSTGGTEALARVIPKLPAKLGVPVLIVQHMPPLFTQNLANSLNGKSGLDVREARNGEAALAGSVYIAPGGSHLKVVAGANQEIVLRVTSDPPENNCRPAVDYLFRSAAVAFPGRAVAVILTGMGRDGTLGLRLLKASGCVSIAQDEATCTVFGMPKEAIQAGVIDLVSPIDSIATEILKAIH